MVNYDQNIFVLYLDLLNVKHTKNFSNKYYQEHPHNNNLYGLSCMLSDYKVENVALKLERSIEGIKEIETPFIAQIKYEFGIIYNITDERVEYFTEGKKFNIPNDEFLKLWTGIVLVGETNKNSREPNFEVNRKEELATKLKKYILLFIIFIVLAEIGYINQVYKQIGLLTSILINTIGIYICYLLLLKQMKIHSKYADRICSLLQHKNDCNDILESDVAKLFGVVSWSEIGLGYFMANILLISCFPFIYSYIAIINIGSLFFTIWSLIYQKWIARQWCPLCLAVQGLLWTLFINNLSFNLVVWPYFSTSSILLIGCIYTFPILILNLLIPYISEAHRVQEITQKLNSMKADDSIFLNLLKQKRPYNIDKNIGIIMGNPEAKNIITIVSNPHCNPCARMHPRFESIMHSTENDFCFQYLLSSFSEELGKSSKLFIAMHKKLSLIDFRKFMNDWYTNGKDNKEGYYEKYHFDSENKQLISNYKKQNEWIKDAAIYSTPTILFNGYPLPEKYKVEDLIYFTDIETSL